MTLPRLKGTFDNLRAFSPAWSELTDELSGEEELRREEGIEELIRLTARFAEALYLAGGGDDLRRRAGLVRQLAADDTSYGKARLELPSPDGTGAAGWADLCSDGVDLAFLPLTMDMVLLQAQVLSGTCTSETQRAVLERFQDELWRLRAEVEKEHVWGSHLIVLCQEDQRPQAATHGDHQRLLEILRQAPSPVKAIKEAAEDLYWAVADPSCRPMQARHSADFRSVHWYGKNYTFTPYQAACVRVLWENWEKGTPDVGHETLLEEAKSDGKRLIDLFKKHPAWGPMIDEGATKGAYRLKATPPAHAAASD